MLPDKDFFMSKLYLKYIICVLIAVSFCNCSGERQDCGYISSLPVRITDGDGWSIISADGTECDTTFDKQPTIAVNGLFSVGTDNGLLTVYRIDGETRAIEGLKGLRSAGVLTEGVIPVARPNSRLELADRDGKTVARLMLADSTEIAGVNPYFSSRRMVFMVKDGAIERFGAINPEGKIVIEPLFSRLHPFRNGTALAATTKSGKTNHRLIDTDGNTLFEFPKQMSPLSDGVDREIMPVKLSGDTIGFINTKGVFRKAPDEVRKIDDFTDQVYVYTDVMGHQGVMDMDGNSVIPTDYKQLHIFDDSHFLAIDEDGNAMALDSEGNRIAEFPDVDEFITLNRYYPFSTGFDIIGHSVRNTYIVFDHDGNQTGEYASIATDLFHNPLTTKSSDMVRSDYIDLTQAIDKFTGPLTSTGYSKAHIGEKAMSIAGTDAEKYEQTYSIGLRGSSGHRFSVSATAYSSEVIAESEAVYGESERIIFGFSLRKFEGFEARFNENAFINRIAVTLKTENPTFETMRSDIESRMKRKGYVTAEQTDAFTIFRSSDDGIIIALIPRAEQRGAIMYILNRPTYDSLSGGIKREAEINFNLNQ